MSTSLFWLSRLTFRSLFSFNLSFFYCVQTLKTNRAWNMAEIIPLMLNACEVLWNQLSLTSFMLFEVLTLLEINEAELAFTHHVNLELACCFLDRTSFSYQLGPKAGGQLILSFFHWVSSYCCGYKLLNCACRAVWPEACNMWNQRVIRNSTAETVVQG